MRYVKRGMHTAYLQKIEVSTSYRVRLPGLRGGYWRDCDGPQPANHTSYLHASSVAQRRRKLRWRSNNVVMSNEGHGLLRMTPWSGLCQNPALHIKKCSQLGFRKWASKVISLSRLA